MYHHLYLDEESARVLQIHLDRLIAASTSLEHWRGSEFGQNFRFVTTSTLSNVRHIWRSYAESLEKNDQAQYRLDFETALRHSRSYKNLTFENLSTENAGARAAAPVSIQGLAREEIKAALDSWWEKGTYGQVPANTNIPNPLFAATLSEHSVLHYGGNPILSYHLATADVQFTESSSVQSDNGSDSRGSLAIVAAAQAQFAEWSQAFIGSASGNVTLRFVAANSLSLCQTLQHSIATGQPSGHFYRRQLSMERLELDPDDYGPQSTTPKQFDVIDTSSLSDYLGTLNIITSSSPLLKSTPWATLYTRTVDRKTEAEKAKFDEILCGPARTIATLLGISPVEYWTNATAVSSVDKYVLDSQNPAVTWQLAWKRHEHLRGQRDQPLRLEVKDDDLVNLIHKIYRTMFASEDSAGTASLSGEQQPNVVRKSSYPTYHPGSLVAFIRSLLHVLDVPKAAVSQALLTKIMQDSTFVLGHKLQHAFSLEMSRQGLYTLPELQQGIQTGPMAPLFSQWSDIPEAVAVTLAIPAVYWQKVAKAAIEAKLSLAVEANMSVGEDATLPHSIYSDVQVVFGSVSTAGDRQSEDLTVTIDEDSAAWSGDSDLIATFVVSAGTLQVDPRHTRVRLCLHNTRPTAAMFGTHQPEIGDPGLSEPIIIYETDLDYSDHVYITKNQPGQDGFALYSSLAPTSTEETTGDYKSVFTANIDSSGVLNTITGRLDMLSPDGKRLLADKAAVDVRKISPFMFEIVLGEREAVYPLRFPVPIVKDGSKTKIARTSAYVEVIAPVAEPATARTLDDFIFPSVLANMSSSLNDGQIISVPLNIPHVNLDNLPVLDVSDKKRLGFLTTLTSWMFSARERKLRDQADESGLAISARMNFKESLFTMFMLASGLQGGQTGLFAIHHPDKGGIHMLLFVSAIRLDGANASVALDAAVIPFTVDIIKGGKLEAFLLILRELECCTITVDDAELALWKKVLPALAERCRNWTHTPECEYAKPGATVPLSTEPGKQVLCSCGAGKLPENFISLPEWDVASQFATRIAISPVYAVPFVEDVVDPSIAESMSKLGLDVQGDETLRCWSCGAVEAKGGGPLKKCMRCVKVKYCSIECQKKDWKKHRMECVKEERI